MKNLLKTALLLLVVLAMAVPASAAVDLSKIVVLGASVDSGFLDGCWVKHGQIDAWPAIFARQAGSDFQQPLLDEPGVGSSKGCMILKDLAPTFDYALSVPKPLNLTLARPYNNLAIPGYLAASATNCVTATAATPCNNPLIDLVLRGSGATTLQQAASLKPTFVIIGVFGNEALGAATSGTVIDGVTLPPTAVYAASYKTIVDTMKAAQGGTGVGVVATIPDISTLAYFTAVSPIIGVNAGVPIYVLGSTGCASGVPVCSVPPGTLVPFPMATLMKTGYGIPCAVAPYPNCNKPLPDNGDAATGLPGLLYPSEVSLLKTRINDYNSQIQTLATADGYKVFDTSALIAGITSTGRDFGGMTVTGKYLQGGFFSYDGVHPTQLGYAIVANDFVNFVNASYGASVPQVDMSVYLFGGNSTGYPLGLPVNQGDVLNYGAAYWTPETLKTWQGLFGVDLRHLPLPEGVEEGPVVPERRGVEVQ